MFDWVLRNARISDDAVRVDIALQNGLIAAIEPAGGDLAEAETAEKRDLNGRVLLPGLVDIHTHLDKTYSTLENKSGTLGEAIQVWHKHREHRTASQIQQAAERALQNAIQNGVTAMRSHIDIGTPNDLLPVEILLDLRQKYATLIDLQFVTLGTAADKPEWAAGMREALDMGVDFVGGCPALCKDPKAEIDAAFVLAEETGKPIDLHVDETEDPNMISLEYLAEKTIKTGMQGRVTAGHCCSLGFVDDEVQRRIIGKVAEAEITIVTLPSCNLVLMGRTISPAPRGTTPVKKLLAAGVNVCAASDNVGDPFNPFGSYDLLQLANLNAHVAHMTGKTELYESLNMVTQRPRISMGLGDGSIKVGNQADLVIVDCTQKLEAILAPPARLATFKQGKLIVETEVQTKWH